MSSSPDKEPPVQVVVVDDNEDIAALLEMLLTAEGYRVDAFSCPLDALSNIRGRERLDMIISDWNMPKVNGEKIAQATKEVHPEASVIVLTATEAERDKARINKLIEDGIVDLQLSKPFNQPVLLYALRNGANGNFKDKRNQES